MQFQESSGNSVPSLNLTGLTYFRIRKIRIRKINKQFNRILFLLTLYQCSGMNCLMISEVLLVWKFLRNPMHIAILIDNYFTHLLILTFYLYIYFCRFHICWFLSLFFVSYIFTLSSVLSFTSVCILLCFIFYPICTYSLQGHIVNQKFF